MRKSSISLALFAVLTACGDQGPAEVGAVRLALAGGSSAQPSGPDARGNVLAIDSATAYVRHIELDLPDAQRCSDLGDVGGLRCDDGSNKLVLDGPFVFDLVEGTSEPSLADVRLPLGTYKRVDVRFDDAEPSEGLVEDGERIANQTLIAEGRMGVDGEELAFDLALKFNEDARFETAAGVEITEERAGRLQLWLDVSSWFSSLPITECIEDGDLEVRDSRLSIQDQSGSCSDLENSLKESIKRSGQLDRVD